MQSIQNRTWDNSELLLTKCKVAHGTNDCLRISNNHLGVSTRQPNSKPWETLNRNLTLDPLNNVRLRLYTDRTNKIILEPKTQAHDLTSEIVQYPLRDAVGVSCLPTPRPHLRPWCRRLRPHSRPALLRLLRVEHLKPNQKTKGNGMVRREKNTN